MSTRALLVMAFVWTALSGCNEGRFPTCKSDTECAGKQIEGMKTPLCYDLRCVACRVDDDCPVDSMCNSVKQCEKLGGLAAPASSASAEPKTEWGAAPPSAPAPSGSAKAGAPKKPKK